jgi:hypothetical protein
LQGDTKIAISTEIADLSIEIAHVYLGDLTPSVARAAAEAAANWIGPLLDRWNRRRLKISITLMLDDYFDVAGGVPPDEGEIMLLEALSHHQIKVDYIAYEASFAEELSDNNHERETLADRFLRLLEPFPRWGESSFGGRYGPKNLIEGSDEPVGWISNGDPTRRGSEHESLFLRSSSPLQPDVHPEHRTSIALDVQIYEQHEIKGSGRKLKNGTDGKERRWSCAYLAACWQLSRLGGFLDPTTNAPVVPPRLKALTEGSGFFANRTLTLLSPSMLRVEHAVRVLLSQVRCDSRFQRRLTQGRDYFDLNDHIAYVFAANDFHHFGRTSNRRK